MKFQIVAAIGTALILSACQMSDTGAGVKMDPLKQALSGKTLTKVDKPSVVVHLNADGSLGGQNNAGELSGTWDVIDGQYCRTIITPAKWKGSKCQEVTVDGNIATFMRTDGSSSIYSMS